MLDDLKLSIIDS